MSSQTTQKPTAPSVRGRVRVDQRAWDLVGRLEPGDIAVIDVPDLDRRTAQALADRRPGAVLDAAPCSTGRLPNRGPGVLVGAGIPVVDDLGSDLMALREGARVRVSGAEVWGAEGLVAAGRELTPSAELHDGKRASSDARTHLEAFAANVRQYAAVRADDAPTVPRLPAALRGRPTLVALSDRATRRQLRDLRGYIAQVHPLLIGADGGADALVASGLTPDVVVGDFRAVSEPTLRRAAARFACAGPDATTPGAERAERLGEEYQVVQQAAPDDAGIALAAANGRGPIVLVGAHAGFEELLDRGRTGMASSLFARLGAGERLVFGETAASLYRPHIATWQLATLLVAALVALAVAVWITPWGHDLFDAAWRGVASVFGRGA